MQNNYLIQIFLKIFKLYLSKIKKFNKKNNYVKQINKLIFKIMLYKLNKQIIYLINTYLKDLNPHKQTILL